MSQDTRPTLKELLSNASKESLEKNYAGELYGLSPRQIDEIEAVLTTFKPDPLTVRFLRVSQWQRVTGMTKSTTFRFIASGELKAYRRGHGLYIPVTEIDRFMTEEVASEQSDNSIHATRYSPDGPRIGDIANKVSLDMATVIAQGGK